MFTTPLYLNAREPLIVSYQEPSLCIKRQSKSDQLFPLRRIERIQVSGNVEWKTAALIACFERGISIQFMDRHNETIGRMVGIGKHRISLYRHLEHLLEISNWQQHYDQWCVAKLMQSRRYVARRLNMPFQNAHDLLNLEQWIEYALPVSYHNEQRKIIKWMQADLYGLIHHHLQYIGLWQNSTLALNEPFDLVQDLGNILYPILLFTREKLIRSLSAGSKISHKQVASWMFTQKGYLYYQIKRIISQLEIWIMDLH